MLSLDASTSDTDYLCCHELCPLLIPHQNLFSNDNMDKSSDPIVCGLFALVFSWHYIS
jgi:hypothetical protein